MISERDQPPAFRQAMIFMHRGDYEGARRCLEQVLAAGDASSDPRRLSSILGNLGNVYAVMGDREKARSCYQKVLALQRAGGEERAVGQTLANLGNLSREAGEMERARAYYLEAADILQRIGDDYSMGLIHNNMGLLQRDTGDAEAAVRSFQRAIELHRKTGNEEGLAYTWGHLGRTYMGLGKLKKSETCLNYSSMHFGQIANPGGEVEALRGLAELYEMQSRPEPALRCFTRMAEIQRRCGLQIPEGDLSAIERLRRLCYPGRIKP